MGTGVPGYDTAMEAAVLRSKGLTYQPDAVLVDPVDNDFGLPNSRMPVVEHARLDHRSLLDLARRV